MGDFVERGRDQSAAEHLMLNADALGLSDDQRDRVTMAWRLEIGTNDQRREAGRLVQAVRDELKADIDAVVAQAKARGEGVAKFNDAGALRIKGRDGFGALYDSGTLSETEFVVGMGYRYLFEAQVGSLRSQLGAEGAPGGSGVNGAPIAALHRAYTSVRVTQADRAILRADPSGRLLSLMRGVVGEGQSLSALVGKGGPRRRAVDGLHSALEVTRAVFTISGLRIGVT